MRYLFTFFFVLPAALVQAAGAGTFFPYPYQQETLPNGLKAIVIPMSSPGLVAYFTVVRTGSRDEVEPGKSGFAHFFEHMMFRGTKKYPGPVYDSLVTGMGAKSNASTTDDFTQFFMTVAKENLEKVIELESDRFQNLSYAKPAFQTEAGAVYGEYRKDVTNPFFLLEEKLADRAYDAHTYKHTTMGFEADVKAMPEAYDYSLSFFQRFYRPENVVILVVGDVEAKSTFALIRKYYSGWKKGYTSAKITPEPPQTAERGVDVSYPGKTLPILCMAYKGAAFDAENRDFAAARLLCSLAFGETSELYKKLVIREQKAQFLFADVSMNRDVPLWSIAAMVKNPEDIDSVQKDIEETIKKFQSAPVSEQKLADVKRHDKYELLDRLDSPERVAEALTRYIALTGGIEALDQLYATYESVTPEDILRAAKEYYRPERRTIAVLKGEK
ncbi:MAG: pitrilysin family protein [Thermoguttaceae bacterium]|jgi:zinc protease